VEALGVEAVRPGDVLFFRRRGPLGYAMRAVDATVFQHVSLVIDETWMAHSGVTGMRAVRLEGVLGSALDIQVRRSNTVTDLAPVTGIARSYVERGGRFAYSHVVLAGAMQLVRRLSDDGALRIASSGSVRAIAKVASRRAAGRRTPMTCSEFVYRCFAESSIGGGAAYLLNIAERRRTPSVDGVSAHSTPALPNFVTPGDLYRSPSLSLVGRLRT
jgi:hypothetical protein